VELIIRNPFNWLILIAIVGILLVSIGHQVSSNYEHGLSSNTVTTVQPSDSNSTATFPIAPVPCKPTPSSVCGEPGVGHLDSVVNVGSLPRAETSNSTTTIRYD
jgi:hypothetical protein